MICLNPIRDLQKKICVLKKKAQEMRKRIGKDASFLEDTVVHSSVQSGTIHTWANRWRTP